MAMLGNRDVMQCNNTKVAIPTDVAWHRASDTSSMQVECDKVSAMPDVRVYLTREMWISRKHKHTHGT